MALTFSELCERLASRVDEISLLEILNINSYDLIDRFQDKIEENLERLLEEYEDF